MMDYNFKKIEKKWQKKWEEKKIFEISEKSKKKKYYILEMYPYPSSSGLHMGHAFNYIIGDIRARFKRMQGFNVLHPMGYDSFGLPAENAAIEEKSHPKKFTDKAIKNYIKQQKILGLSYDWTRKLESHDINYYKWNQWIFLQMYKKGLAYRKKSPVNFCKKCDTVLANEQVHNGRCWRHEDTEVEIKNLEQWFLKITEYAEELLEDIEKLDWPERIKIMQRNWIGKSEGVDIYFKLEGSNKVLPTFTTRCDTVYSVTFLAIAPENPLIDELIKATDYESPVKEFIKKTLKQKVEDRINEEKEKEGIFTGRYAINPFSKEKIPIYVANFALMYGSGIVMCDAHDKRDFAFAKKYKIPLKFVISKDGKEVDANKSKEAYLDDGVLFNSGKFNGMGNRKALSQIAKWIEAEKFGKRVVNYKLRDWLVSRQRYWGTPIPVLYDEKGNVTLVDEKDLPVRLPDKVKFGKGNPLETSKSFLTLKKNGITYRRETDTMDTFFDSSWYFLRFTDPKNKNKIFDQKKSNYWMPVDFYTGGAEHACMHLIYARFVTKVLRDLGLVNKNLNEPFKRLFNQGMVHGEDKYVMSKSRGNVVDPLDIVNKYGADSLRIFLISMSSPDSDLVWNTTGLESIHKFLIKIFNYFSNVKIGKSNEKVESKVNKTIKEVTEEIENLKYNIAVIKLRTLFDYLNEKEISKKDLESCIKLLSLFCPYLTEELWEKIGNKNFLILEKWPESDKKKIDERFEREEQSIRRLIEDINHVAKLIKEKESKNVKKVFVYVLPNEKEIFNSETDLIKKRTGLDIEVYSVSGKNKYDPENKSKKVKPGKPGIYLE